MVYSKRAPRRQQFHVAPAVLQLNSAVTTSADIQNAMCKATITYSETRTTGAQWVCPKLCSACEGLIPK